MIDDRVVSGLQAGQLKSEGMRRQFYSKRVGGRDGLRGVRDARGDGLGEMAWVRRIPLEILDPRAGPPL